MIGANVERLRPLLASQRLAFEKRFGSHVAATLERVALALDEERLVSYVSLEPDALGYALVVPGAGPDADVLTALWVASGNESLARRLISSAVTGSRARRRRLEAQDLGFGEDDCTAALCEIAVGSWDRLYLRADVVEPGTADLLGRLSIRPFGDGDLLSAATISARAFASTSEPMFSVSHRTTTAALKRLGLAVAGGTWGPFERECSPVAVDGRGTILGFAVVTRFGSDTAHLGEIAVVPDAAGKGLGTILLDWILVELFRAGFSEVTLCVSADNARAISLYRNRGFRRVRSFGAHVLWPGKKVDSTGQILPAGRTRSRTERVSGGES